MTEQLIGETGSKKRRRFLFVPIVLVACIALFVVAGAQAVHDETFQLDGNTVTGAPTNIGGHTQNVDWDSLFDANGDTLASLPAGFGDANLVKDFQNSGNTFITNDQTTFATGSKDTLPISGWQCNFDNNVNSKIDVMNSYAATYTAPDGDEILYFGIERNVNTGTANVGFWFLQSPVGCSSTGGAVSFTGEHQDGDVLVVVSEFSGGGTVSTINAYRWDKPGAGPGSLNPVPIAAGVDCRDPLLPGGDATCGAANRDAITTPWLTAQKTTVGHNLGTALFFEAGLNLSESGLGGQCFSTFLGDTRSSTSLTATLFDFSGGTLGECGVSVTTTPSQSTRVLGSAAPITDLADISGTGAGGSAPTPTGTMTFFLCAPSQVTAEGCPAGAGTQVGTAVTLGACNPVVAGHACATSANAASLITVLGKYCFRAVYDPGTDPNYQGKGGSFTANPGECFTVTGSSSFTTAQSWVPNDSATLTGDANLNGTLTFTLYNDATCGVGGGTSQYTENVTVTNAASGTSFSTSNTTAVVAATDGNYSWLVHYNDNVLSDPADSCSETTAINITN